MPFIALIKPLNWRLNNKKDVCVCQELLRLASNMALHNRSESKNTGGSHLDWDRGGGEGFLEGNAFTES